jgi:four helix bundle protein
MNKEELKNRTKKFAISSINFVDELPKSAPCKVIGNQLLRSATSTAANYRAACRSRSTAEFISKLGNVLEEADESAFWLELILEGKLFENDKLHFLLTEANELSAIFFSARRSTMQKLQKPRSKS